MSIVMLLVAAVVSALRGKRFVHETHAEPVAAAALGDTAAVEPPPGTGVAFPR